MFINMETIKKTVKMLRLVEAGVVGTKNTKARAKKLADVLSQAVEEEKIKYNLEADKTKLEKDRQEAADEKWDNYDPYKEGDIPDETEIVDVEGWEKDGSDMWLRKFYRTADVAGEDSIMMSFVVTFEKGTAKIVDAHAN